MNNTKIVPKVPNPYIVLEPLKNWAKSDLERFHSLLISDDFGLLLRYLSEDIAFENYIELSAKSREVDLKKIEQTKYLFGFRNQLTSLPTKIRNLIKLKTNVAQEK